MRRNVLAGLFVLLCVLMGAMAYLPGLLSGPGGKGSAPPTAGSRCGPSVCPCRAGGGASPTTAPATQPSAALIRTVGG